MIIIIHFIVYENNYTSLTHSIIALLLIIYHNPIIDMLTFLISTLVNEILYPSMALYIIILIASNIMLIATVVNNNINRFIKGISYYDNA